MKLSSLIIAFIFLGAACSMPYSKPAGKTPSGVPAKPTPSKTATVNASEKESLSSLFIISENILIDGISTEFGQVIKKEPGMVIIEFKGVTSIPVAKSNDEDTLNDSVEAMKFLGCISVLPLCALTRSNIFSGNQRAGNEIQYTYEDWSCSALMKIETRAGYSYTIDAELDDKKPYLKVVTKHDGQALRFARQDIICLEDPAATQ